jgi:hypothetical protein
MKLPSKSYEPIKWISVEESLPELCETVLLVEKGKVTVGWLESCFSHEDPIYFCPEDSSYPEEGAVTHWMPLPKPPKANE